MSNSSKSRTRYLNVAVSFFGVGVPLLYLVGYLAIDGYLSAYGLSIKAFPVPWERILVTSFKVLLDGLITTWVRLMMQAEMLLLLTGSLAVILLIMIHLVMRRPALSKEKKENFTQKVMASTWFIYAASPVLLLICFFMFVFLFALLITTGFFIASAYTVGEELAKSEIESFTHCYSTDSSCVFIFKNNEKVVEGRLVTMSDKYTAVYDGKRTHLIQNDNLRIEAEPK